MEQIKSYRHTSKHFIASFLLAVMGLAMIVAAMFVPPAGYIDPTVLAAFGEILTFAGALAGMDYKNGKAEKEKD